jgi:hypothetical protein
MYKASREIRQKSRRAIRAAAFIKHEMIIFEAPRGDVIIRDEY